MPLANSREKLGGNPTRKKLLFVFLGIVVLLLVLIFFEVIYCLKSENCLLSLARLSPFFGKMVGVEETDLAYRRGNYFCNKNQPDLLNVSGEIIKVEKDKLVLRFDNGTEKTFLVKKGSKFNVLAVPVNENKGSESKIFEFKGDNLEDFINPGYQIIGQVDFSNSQIFSDSINNGIERIKLILVFQES